MLIKKAFIFIILAIHVLPAEAYDVVGPENFKKYLEIMTYEIENKSEIFVKNENKQALLFTTKNNNFNLFAGGSEPDGIFDLSLGYDGEGYGIKEVYVNLNSSDLERAYYEGDYRITINHSKKIILLFSKDKKFVYLQPIFNNKNKPIIIIKRNFSDTPDDIRTKFLKNGDLFLAYWGATDEVIPPDFLPTRKETIPIDYNLFKQTVDDSHKCYELDQKYKLNLIQCPLSLSSYVPE